MGKLILVRHGHTSLNGPGDDERLRAWLDVPLDEKGLREAAETADKLTHYPIEVIYCSDLRRARARPLPSCGVARRPPGWWQPMSCAPGIWAPSEDKEFGMCCHS
jgi:broad specificity phosphatase PhoE